MNRMKFIAGLCAIAFLAAMPVVAQTDANKPKEPPKPALGPSAAIIEQWNEVGRKLIAMAEDFPEDKYEYKPNPDSRTFAANLIHVSASMYYFTDLAQGNKPRYADDPKRDDLKSESTSSGFRKKVRGGWCGCAEGQGRCSFADADQCRWTADDQLR